MVFTANDLSNWEDFPKGLKVLFLAGDGSGDGAGDGHDCSAAETRSKLESLDYIVTTFNDETEALAAVFKNPASFHIAIVEMNPNSMNESFKFLEAAKDLPTIMISTDHCITTTMKCIALGAVEFLQKPLSIEKLNNIWQHVVHKAFNDGGNNVKESVASILHLEVDTDMAKIDPSTPQLKQGSRLLDDGDCQENVNFLTEKEIMEDQDIDESKSVDITDRNHGLEDEKVIVIKEEKLRDEEEVETEDMIDSGNVHKKEDEIKSINKQSTIKNLSSNKSNRKKVDWTPELHKKFVQAVEQLGVDQAIPSRILELMKVDGLTRHNIASHLQKFRMHRRNILPKEDHERRWIQSRENHRQMQRGYNGFNGYNNQLQQRPVMAYPAPQVYPVWALPGVPTPGVVPPLWPPTQTSGHPPPWHWKPPYPTVNGNAWGCPVIPPATGAFNTSPTTSGGGFQYSTGAENGFRIMPATQPDEEMIDKVVKEAISKPWLPLPLGLKPPSADSVLAELSRQGISAVPSSSSSRLINGSRRLRAGPT